MSFLDVIKRGAGAVAHGAKAVGTGMQEALREPNPAPAPVEAPAPQDKPPGGFTLPELDPNDPDFAHKQEIHNALLALDKQFTEANPKIDYQGHYNQIAAEMKNKEPRAKEWNPISKFAIALGTQNPNNPWAPNEGLATMKENSDKQLEADRKNFDETMALKKEAMSGHIRDLLDQGKFRQALGMLAQKEAADISSKRQEHELRTAEIEQGGKIKENLAHIAAKSALDRATARAEYVRQQSNTFKLTPSDKKMMDEEYKKADMHLADIKKQWANGMLSDDQVQQAEEEHRLELKRVHDKYEDLEIAPGTTEKKGANKPTAKGMQPNSADPWFSGGK